MAVQLEEILATIRQRESGGNYGAEAHGSSASGAYQFIDSTWQGLLGRYGLSGPNHASDAAPALQDYVASRYIADILGDHGGDLRAVPAVWYTGRYDPANLDRVPSPEAGNNLSVRSYIDGWLQELSQHSPGMGSGAGPVALDLADRPASGGPTALDTFLSAALAQQGDRYVFGHEVDLADVDPETFDCSELVQWAASQAGVELTDGSWLQYRSLAGDGGELSVDQALRTPGALLFSFSGDPTSGGRPSRAHVAISLGDGTVIEARNPRAGVLVADATNRSWTHAAVIDGLGAERSTGWPVTAPLPPAPAQFGLDGDSDGLLDEHERFIGTDPFAVDTDLDGFIDSAELRAGTDPLDAADNPLARSGGLGPVYVPPLTPGSGGGEGPGPWSVPSVPVDLPPVSVGPLPPPPAPEPAVPAPAAAEGPPPEPEPDIPSAPAPAPEPGDDELPSGSPSPVPAPEGVPEPVVAEEGPAPGDVLEPGPAEVGPAGSPSDEGGVLPAPHSEAEELFDRLSASARSNVDLAAYLDDLGIESADELYRLPGSFAIDDWT